MPKPKFSIPPLPIFLLVIVMLSASGFLIYDRVTNFYDYRLVENNTPLVDPDAINLQLVSGIAFLGVSVVPILLAIGLWSRKSWARFLSICFFSAIMFPVIAVSLDWISPPSPDNLLQIPTILDDVLVVNTAHPTSKLMKINPYLAIVSVIALFILLNPAIAKFFRHSLKSLE
jgi:hypothetical protein